MIPILDWIFEGIANWVASIVTDLMDAVSGLFLQALGTDMLAMEEYFPSNVKFTRPKGGMFTWVTLEEGKDVMKLFDEAIKRKVAFVPGHPFYVNPLNVNTLRLNYTNADSSTIRTGIEHLAEAMKQL